MKNCFPIWYGIPFVLLVVVVVVVAAEAYLENDIHKKKKWKLLWKKLNFVCTIFQLLFCCLCFHNLCRRHLIKQSHIQKKNKKLNVDTFFDSSEKREEKKQIRKFIIFGTFPRGEELRSFDVRLSLKNLVMNWLMKLKEVRQCTQKLWLIF